ncbi:hypothetical protein L0Y49_04125 [bacterium]|nr:hypothetical protein [bacterium]
MAKPEFHIIKGGKDTPMPERTGFETTTDNDYSIEEEKIFSKGEILGIIEQLARSEGISAKDLELAEESIDSYGNLIALVVDVKGETPKKQGWTSVFYEYRIKGQGQNSFSENTSIARIYNNEDEETANGGIVARFENGVWKLAPGTIDTRGDDVAALEDAPEKPLE